jgi:hypothetical protein
MGDVCYVFVVPPPGVNIVRFCLCAEMRLKRLMTEHQMRVPVPADFLNDHIAPIVRSFIHSFVHPSIEYSIETKIDSIVVFAAFDE